MTAISGINASEYVLTPVENKPTETPEEGEGPCVIIAHDSRLGDKRIRWKPGDSDSLAKAKAFFDERIKRGFLAYKIGRKGVTKGEVIREFDPKASRIMMIPQQVGG